jgi:hypothetical protein
MKFFFGVFIIVFFFSCVNKTTTEQPSQYADTSINNKTSFFPVTSFLKGQMLQFDSILITPLYTITTKEKTDSEWLKRDQLKILLQPFLTPEINDSNLVQYFKETKFNDQTLNAITFTYDPITPLPDSINLLTWNVYIDPEKGNVTRIYLVKKIKENNKEIIKQLTWQTNKYAEIITILNEPDGKSELMKKERFTWNFDQ